MKACATAPCGALASTDKSLAQMNKSGDGVQRPRDMAIYDEYQIVINEAQRRLIMRALTNAIANDRRSTAGGALSRPTEDEWMQLIGCSARSNRLCENGCPDFSLLLLLGADEQIFGVNEQILGPDQSDQWASACPWWWHRPTDARVIAGTVLGVASMFARRHW